MNFNDLKYFNLYTIDNLTAGINSNNTFLDTTALEDLYMESYSNSIDLPTSIEEMMLNNPVQNDFSQLSNLSFFRKDIFTDNTFFLGKMSNITTITNNYNTLYKFSPQIQDLTSELEVISTEYKDESTLEYTRTIPDGKLYYPEPFIASPSFLHEEI
jgi:hypothetical protein